MILFRLFDFTVRVFLSFLFVFILQVQFDGKSLESYLTHFGENFFLTKALDSVGEDGVKIVRNFTQNKEDKQSKRNIANEKAIQTFENFTKRISHPKKDSPRKED